MLKDVLNDEDFISIQKISDKKLKNAFSEDPYDTVVSLISIYSLTSFYSFGQQDDEFESKSRESFKKYIETIFKWSKKRESERQYINESLMSRLSEYDSIEDFNEIEDGLINVILNIYEEINSDESLNALKDLKQRIFKYEMED